MSDSLIHEVDEDLQRKQMEAFWKKHGNTILGCALAIVLATALFTGWKSYKTRSEQKATAAVVTVLNDKQITPEKQIELLERYAKNNPESSLAVFARLQAALAALRENKNDKALEIYKALAVDPTVEPEFRQLGELYVLQAELDTGEPAALQARLQKLIDESPWKASAKEFSGLLALRTGDKAAAKKLFTELTTDTDVPASIAGRASSMRQWLGEGDGGT